MQTGESADDAKEQRYQSCLSALYEPSLHPDSARVLEDYQHLSPPSSIGPAGQDLDDLLGGAPVAIEVAAAAFGKSGAARLKGRDRR